MAMTLKRLYHRTAEGVPVRDASGQLQMRGVQVLAAGGPGTRQHFTPHVVESGVAHGWLTLGGGRLVVQAEAGAVVYRLDRPPGTYCDHCGAGCDDSPAAAAHVAAMHPGATSPDPANPSGYRRDHFYACTRME